MNFWKAIFAFVFLPLYIGGSSKSSNATTTTYSTTDDRIAAAEGAIVTRLQGSDVASTITKFTGNNNNVTTADPEIVKAALDFAGGANAAAGITLENVLARQESYAATSSGKFNERNILILAIAGIAALFILRRKAA